MEELLRHIQDWPVIVQGALGSALFALTLFLGQWVFGVASAVLSKASSKRRQAYLRSRLIRFRAITATGNAASARYASVLLFRASRDLTKALIWLTLGLMFDNLVGPFGTIGYLGCLYHLFFALEVVKPIRESSSDALKKIEAIEEELERQQRAAAGGAEH